MGKFKDKDILNLFDKCYSKIIDKYNSNKLKYCTDFSQAFLLTSKHNCLNIIDYIYDIDYNANTNIAKYDICIKTCMIEKILHQLIIITEQFYEYLPNLKII